MGVSPDTHFAQVLVEADYRMKLIGIGLEDPPVKMTTFIDKATPAVAAQRPAPLVLRARLQVRPNGRRRHRDGTGRRRREAGRRERSGAGRRHAAGFGRPEERRQHAVHDDLHARSIRKSPRRKPVYAQLRNLIDMSIAAAFIQQQDYYGQAELEGRHADERREVPDSDLPSSAASRHGRDERVEGESLLTPVAGGVTIQARQALTKENLIADERGQDGPRSPRDVPEKPPSRPVVVGLTEEEESPIDS